MSGNISPGYRLLRSRRKGCLSDQARCSGAARSCLGSQPEHLRWGEVGLRLFRPADSRWQLHRRGDNHLSQGPAIPTQCPRSEDRALARSRCAGLQLKAITGRSPQSSDGPRARHSGWLYLSRYSHARGPLPLMLAQAVPGGEPAPLGDSIRSPLRETVGQGRHLTCRGQWRCGSFRAAFVQGRAVGETWRRGAAISSTACWTPGVRSLSRRRGGRSRAWFRPRRTLFAVR